MTRYSRSAAIGASIAAILDLSPLSMKSRTARGWPASRAAMRVSAARRAVRAFIKFVAPEPEPLNDSIAKIIVVDRLVRKKRTYRGLVSVFRRARFFRLSSFDRIDAA